MLPRDCQDILRLGSRQSDVYTIYPEGTGGFAGVLWHDHGLGWMDGTIYEDWNTKVGMYFLVGYS